MIVHVDIWSDVVCPWCYLGRRRFDTAVERLGWASDEISVRTRAYQLDPKATSEPGDLRSSIEKKYGPGAFDGMTARLTALGAGEGIDYHFDLALRVNTLDAHRLLAWAWEIGHTELQHQLEENLFRAYFTEGRNIADHDELAEIASDSGLDPSEARRILEEGDYSQHVGSDLEAAIELQITGVPAFVVDGQFVIPGAQEVETFVRILQRIGEKDVSKRSSST